MSYQAATWAVSVRTGNLTLKAVLMALANYADENASCFPGQETLAEELEVSTRTVMRAMEKLEEMGFISRDRRTRPNGSRTTDRITLSMGVPVRTPADHQGDNLSLRTKVTNSGGLSDKACHPQNSQGNSNKGTQDARARPSQSANPKRRSQVPPDFTPNEANLKRAFEMGIPQEHVALATELFISYWKGEGGTKLDWQATFRNSLPILRKQVHMETANGRQSNQLTPYGAQRTQPSGSTLSERFDLLREIIKQGGEAS